MPQKEVAEFFRKMRKVTALDGIEYFVGLFQGVFANGVEGLLAIPWAPVRSAQARHNGHRLLKKPGRSRRIASGK